MKTLDIASKYVFPSFVDREKLQNILNRITTQPTELDSMTWHLNGVILDFGMLGQLQHRYPTWWKNRPIDLFWLMKLLYLESVDNNKNKDFLKDSFDALIKTFFFLAENNTYSFEKGLLVQYISYLMMYTIERAKLVSLLRPRAYQAIRRYLICFCGWPRILSIYGLKGLVLNGVFSEKVVNSAVQKAIEIESGGDLTYRDWKDGGSFNHLTLDYGRYYVEHCTEFFDQNIWLALAIQKTLQKLPDIVETAGFSNSKGNMVGIKTFVNEVLAGVDSSSAKPSFEKIRQAVLRDFSSNLRQVRAIEKLRTDSEIDGLAKIVCFKVLDEDKRELIKHLIDIRESILIPDFAPTFSSKGDFEFNCFKLIIGSSVDLDALNDAIDCAYRRLFQSVSEEQPPLSFYESMEGLSNDKDFKSGPGVLLRFINNVKNSGIVKFVAQTGWRDSEFGFGLSDTEISFNEDPLDQYVCPVRYGVNWVVPKTQGDTKLYREFTNSTYRCAYQLCQLVSEKADDPCLYSFNAAKGDPKKSQFTIYRAISTMWSHFVRCYEPFVKLDFLEELDDLRSNLSRDDMQETRFTELEKRAIHEQWDSLKLDPLLIEARRRARDEADRVIFYLNPYKPKDWIWKYRNGNLEKGLKTLLDTYLSAETRTIIKSLQTKQDVTRALTIGITNELIGDCLYPTPHAFRHMWAEAVYRRFDGDVGWMIRSQFKHISLSMWLAYIRNKDNRRQHDKVKRQVVSSLLANYVLKKGEGYAGAMDKLLRRLFLLTTFSTIEQLKTDIDQYGMLEIVDIKANPWGYCLLRRRNQAHAKCADGGVPQRHNASPEFCLGCTHNLTQETSIPGIVLGISNDLKVLNTPEVPESFRRVAYNTVSNALIHLRKLGADQDTLSEIETALKAGAEKRRLS